MRYRMVAIDVDGTLLDPEGDVRPAVQGAIREAMNRGVLVTLATGRRFDSAQEIARRVGVRLPLVLHGGTLVQDSATGAVLYEDSMPERLVRDVVDEVLREGQQPLLYRSPSTGEELLSGPPEYDSAALAEYASRQPAVRRLPHSELSAVSHVLSVGVFSYEDVLQPLYERFSGWSRCKVLLWMGDPAFPNMLDVLRAGCSKARALGHLAHGYGIRMDEVMAVGDQINDFEMIEAAGLGVAMGNAIPELQALADVVVGTNEQDGLAEAIHRFVLSVDPVASVPRRDRDAV